MLQTSNYDLNKPEGNDVVDISVLNENFDVIDTTMKTLDNRTAPYVVTNGSANTYIATINGITSYTAGMRICVQINVTSTGASTLNINGLGAKIILDSLGNLISSGGLKANIPYQLCYNGSNFIVLGKGGGGNVTTDKVLNGYTFTNDTGQYTGTMPNITTDQVATSITQNETTINFLVPKGYWDGTKKLNANATTIDADCITSNIRAGVNIMGIDGKYSVVDTSDATASSAQIVSGYYAYINGIRTLGQATVENLGGRMYSEGSFAHVQGSENTINLSFNPRILYITWTRASSQIVNLVSTPDTSNIYYTRSSTSPSGFTKNSNGFSIDSGIENSSFSWYCWN